MPDLTLEPTEDLIREVQNRFDASIFCGARSCYDGARTVRTTEKIQGPFIPLLGLCTILEERVKAEMNKTVRDAEIK